MEYNTVRPKMIISEYGRSVQKMIDHLMTIEDKEARTRNARTIIHVMGQINPSIKEYNDYKHRLWDHLHIMANYQLDVDSPYPKPEPESGEINITKPEGQARHIRFRYYGRSIEKIIKSASALPDGEEREAFVKAIGNHMKKSYITWNRDNITDDIINEHLASLSSGELKLSDNARLESTNDIIARQKKQQLQRHKPINKTGGKPGNNFFNRNKRRY